jgi:hypothetical protein
MRWRQINDRKTRAPSSGSELRIPNAAAQTRVVSMAGIRLGSWKSARAFKGMADRGRGIVPTISARLVFDIVSK